MQDSPFAYLADVAAKYGIDEIQVVSRKQEIIDGLNEGDFAALAAAYREIERRGDVGALSRYVYAETDKRRSRPLLMLLFLFGDLANRGIEPFASGTVRLLEKEYPPLDWTKLPGDLRYLAEPAEKYGKYQFDEEIDGFIETMTVAQRAELKVVADAMQRNRETINEFLDKYPMTEHKEAALVYFLEHLIAMINDQRGFE
jgi:hypothetical protein